MLSTNSDTGLAGSSTSPSQQQRQIRFQSPLGPDVLLFERMAATEQLSQPFNFEVTLLSKRPDIRGAEVLGNLFAKALITGYEAYASQHP